MNCAELGKLNFTMLYWAKLAELKWTEWVGVKLVELSWAGCFPGLTIVD